MGAGGNDARTYLACSWSYGLGAINVDTGAGSVTADNVEAVAGLAAEGLR